LVARSTTGYGKQS